MNTNYTPLSIKPDETARSMFRRKALVPFELGLPQPFTPTRHGRESGFFQGDIVEIYGNSKTGKTEVLMDIVSNIVIPSSSSIAPRTVYYFDNDNRLDIDRLSQIFESKIRNDSTSNPVLSEEAGVLLSNALKKVMIIRCTNVLEYVAAIELVNHEVQNSEALVVIDSLGSFHFQQKITEASAGDGAAFTQQPIRSLIRLVKERNVLILAAKPMLFKPRGIELEHREFMPVSWQQQVTTRITLNCKCTYGTWNRTNVNEGHVVFEMTQSKSPFTSLSNKKECFIVSDHGMLFIPYDSPIIKTMW